MKRLYFNYVIFKTVLHLLTVSTKRKLKIASFSLTPTRQSLIILKLENLLTYLQNILFLSTESLDVLVKNC